ncbi:MAG: hypothetical protein IPJ61_21370 [Tessaracoccus sp.]|nr:hypothetical protein [Tessaracoccus sp.]MBK7823539.1 hypothetical protein [Tessaracoccus sp.]
MITLTLAALDVEVEAVEHQLGTERLGQAAHAQVPARVHLIERHVGGAAH